MSFKLPSLPGLQTAKNLINGAKTEANKVVHTVQADATAAVKTVKAEASHLADGFSSAAKTVRSTATSAVSLLAPKADKTTDGKFVGADGKTYPASTPLSDIPHVKPQGTKPSGETVIYVNGIRTDLATEQVTMQAIANKTGSEVIGIHNSTEGTVADLVQCLEDKADKGSNPAVDTLADTVYSELKAGHDVHLMAHSQGGLITARALTDVRNRLIAEDGMTPAQAEQALSHLKVETFGSAGSHYPNGPQYVHYVGSHDAIPNLFGIGAPGTDKGRGAQLHVVPEKTWNLLTAHDIDTTYLNARVPFADARAGDFSHPRPGV